MKEKKLAELNYDLELEKAVKEIQKGKYKRVLIQLPEGFKPYAMDIYQEIKNKLGEKNKTEIMIWLDSCFGACDVPLEVQRIGVDLIIQFGHSAWKFEDKRNVKLK
ncbi:MAG: diphthamide synthesis protein [archaeon]|nr:diphthamide synthesis protein [archaeon]